jgi:DNA/RNA-binding domain of Phe-tRNA-synthetase-like protein
MTGGPRVAVAPEVAGAVRPAVLLVDVTPVLGHDPRLDAPLAAAAAALRAARDPGTTVTAVRAMYKRFGIDPTKTRPSSEALLRRVRKGEPLPRVNAAVDVCNWCSAETQFPYGLYDRDRIEGDIVLRVGRAGESYGGIRKDVVHLEGRPALVDAVGPFGNPTSDSARTRVQAGATHLLFVIFAPRELPAAAAEGALDLTARRAAEYLGAVERGRGLP